MSGTASRDAMDAYDCIAQDFKAARRRAWPSIKEIGNCAGMAVLDLGAGAGRNAVALAEADAALVVAADISIGMLEGLVSEGRHLDRIMPVLCDAMALPFREGAFDAAVCIAMIHHVAGRENRRRALRETRAVVKEGGIVLVTAWARLQGRFAKRLPSMLLARGRGGECGDAAIPWGNKATRFYHLYTKGELASDLAEAGFKLERVYGERIRAKFLAENWVAVGRKGLRNGERETSNGTLP